MKFDDSEAALPRVAVASAAFRLERSLAAKAGAGGLGAAEVAAAMAGFRAGLGLTEAHALLHALRATAGVPPCPA